LKNIPTTVAHHVTLKELPSGKVQISADIKKLRNLSPLLRSHVTSILHLLSTLSDSNTIRLTLASLLLLLPYTLSFRKIVKEVGKVVAGIWSDASSDDATRISTFLILRKMIAIGDSGIKESVLKTVYQSLIKGCRNTTIHNVDAINLMKNSAAELWGIDQTVGYNTGFAFIRQLAMHLRSTITNKTKDSYKVVYNWQCVHSLDFWSRVLAQNCSLLRELSSSKNAKANKDVQLQPLIYPVTQVTIGVMRLIPSAQYFPLRFHLFRSLLRISVSTNTYIPLAPTLYEVLTSRELKRPAKPSTLKPMDFATSIRASKSLLGTRIYQDAVGEHVVELFSEFFTLWCKSISFPELALPVIVMLKRWLKEAADKKTGNKNSKINSAMTILIQKLEANSTWIEKKRVKVDFAPNNRSGVERFLKEESWEDTPLGAYVKSQRSIREEKQKVLEQSRIANSKKTNGRTPVQDNEDSDHEDVAVSDSDS
jgi:nucleolar complex protein 2